MGAHVAPTASSLLSGLTVKITKVSGGTAGSAPTITFTMLNNAGAAVSLSALGSISATMSGPTTNYGSTNFGSTVSTPGYVTESMAGATCSSAGTCMYTFTHAIPATATGTFAIGIEARRSETVPELINGATVQTAIQYGTPNPVTYFSVDGSTAADRRTVVALSNCNRCHVNLQLHGGLRNNTEYCVMCHNPNNTDASTRASATNPADKAAPPQGINFNLLVHRIHDGVNMQAAGRTYAPSSDPRRLAASVDFSSTLFPAMGPTGAATDTENCSLCHVNSTEQNNLTLTGLLPVTDPQGPINPVQPFTSACTGCHVDLPSASHALSNTTVLGEACSCVTARPAPTPSIRCMRNTDAALVWLCLTLAALPAGGQTPAGQPAGPAPLPPGYAGLETCEACHEDIAKAFAKSPHNIVETDKKRGFAGRACEACHGPGEEHAESADATKIRNPLKLAAAAADKLCLTCHLNTSTHVGRLESSHAKDQVACTTCHKMHSNGGADLVVRAPAAINQQCAGCHQSVWAQFQRPNHHKLPEGAMSCVDCHNPHGSIRPAMAQAFGANEPGCLNCHGDKRGPFTFEHGPVRFEGCAT